jgi:hypothetical protein
MTNEERDIISQFVARIGGAPPPAGAVAGSVPATTAAPLPPVDRDADSLIGQLFQRYPEAGYRMTQLAFVQEQGLIQAQRRIADMEAELQRTRQALQQAQQQPQPQQPQQSQGGGGFFSSLFGGGRPQPAPPPNPGPWGGQQAAPPPPGYGQPPPGYAPPPPQYAPGYQPGMFQRSGSGFLGSALTTAAGVAGGMVAGNLLTNMLTGGHHTDGGSAWGDSSGGIAGNPWGAGAATDQGTWDNTGAAAASGQDAVDSGTWDQQPAQDSSWTDNSGGGWNTSSGDSSGWDPGSSDSSDSSDSGGGSSDDSF